MITLPHIAEVAATVGLLSPFIIVGTGVVLGLTLAISKVMLGMVIGMIEIFNGVEEEE